MAASCASSISAHAGHPSERHWMKFAVARNGICIRLSWLTTTARTHAKTNQHLTQQHNERTNERQTPLEPDTKQRCRVRRFNTFDSSHITRSPDSGAVDESRKTFVWLTLAMYRYVHISICCLCWSTQAKWVQHYGSSVGVGVFVDCGRASKRMKTCSYWVFVWLFIVFGFHKICLSLIPKLFYNCSDCAQPML